MNRIIIIVLMLTTCFTYAGEDSVYDFLWLDQDKKVYVLQNKEFKKSKRFFLEGNVILNQTAVFQETYGANAKVGYYLSEEWGLEGYYNFYSNSDNTAYENVQLLNSGEPYVRRLTSAYGLNVVWSPFYGKINTFNKIFYFDWSFAAGPAWFNSESNLDTVFDDSLPNKYISESAFGFNLKTSLKLYLNKNLYLNLDFYRLNFFVRTPDKPTGKSLAKETELALGIGWAF